MTPDAFENVIKGLLEDMNLRIVHSTWVNDEEIDILAHSPAPISIQEIVHVGNSNPLSRLCSSEVFQYSAFYRIISS